MGNRWWGSLWRWLWVDAYLWDWVAAAALIIINLVIPEVAIEPRNRYVTPGDPTLSYPFLTNTVPSSALYLLVFVLPGLTFIIASVIQRTPADGHHALLSLAEGFALASGWKRWMNLVGRLRPNWFATLATGSASKIDDARLAYPSGHSAYMFFSATILTAWLLGKLHVLSPPSSHTTGPAPARFAFVRLLVCTLPLVLATYVACTRLADYKHDFSDVNAGCFIGMATGLAAYLLNFHSLTSGDSHQCKLRTRLSPFNESLVPAALLPDLGPQPSHKVVDQGAATVVEMQT